MQATWTRVYRPLHLPRRSHPEGCHTALRCCQLREPVPRARCVVCAIFPLQRTDGLRASAVGFFSLYSLCPHSVYCLLRPRQCPQSEARGSSQHGLMDRCRQMKTPHHHGGHSPTGSYVTSNTRYVTGMHCWWCTVLTVGQAGDLVVIASCQWSKNTSWIYGYIADLKQHPARACVSFICLLSAGASCL